MEERKKESESWNNIKTGANVVLALSLLIRLILGIWFFGNSIYRNYSDELKESLISFVILSTSLVAGAYVFIKIYIENQLDIKERKMLQEYLDKLDQTKKEMKEEMNRLFTEKAGDVVDLTIDKLKKEGLVIKQDDSSPSSPNTTK